MAFSTFPFTPDYPHGETARYAVTVTRFEDASEQRNLESADRGLTLSYQWTYIDSSLLLQVSSWFLGQIGPGLPFQVLDHRTGSLQVCRFADNAFESLRGAAQTRQLRLQFTAVQSAGSPAGYTFTRPGVGPCFTLSFSTVATPDLPPGPPAAPDSFAATSGGDVFTFDAGSTLNLTAYHIPYATTVLNNNFSPNNAKTNTLYVNPMIVTTSRTLLEMAVFLTTSQAAGAFGHFGIYATRSSATVDCIPGSLVAICGSLNFATSGANILSGASGTVLPPNLYYLAMLVMSAGPSLPTLKSVSPTQRFNYAFGQQAAPSGNRALSIQGRFVSDSGGASLPTTFPSSFAFEANEWPALAVRFLN